MKGEIFLVAVCILLLNGNKNDVDAKHPEKKAEDLIEDICAKLSEEEYLQSHENQAWHKLCRNWIKSPERRRHEKLQSEDDIDGKLNRRRERERQNKRSRPRLSRVRKRRTLVFDIVFQSCTPSENINFVCLDLVVVVEVVVEVVVVAVAAVEVALEVVEVELYPVEVDFVADVLVQASFVRLDHFGVELVIVFFQFLDDIFIVRVLHLVAIRHQPLAR